MENNKNKKSVKFQGDMFNFCDFIQFLYLPEIITLNHDRPNLRQPGKGVSHQPPVLLLSKVKDGTIIQSEV